MRASELEENEVRASLVGPQGEDIAASVHGDTKELDVRDAILVLIVSSVGNLLEWFDFAIFGSFADTISKLFYSSQEAVDGLILTYAVFAVGFCARPVGAMIFGYVGDHWGRKRALLLSIQMMAIGTVSIGCMPTRETIGPVAPVLVLLARCLQGISVGGQLVGALVLTVETAPSDRRGLFGATCLSTANMGIVLGSALAALLHEVLSEEALLSWGWRIPFLSGAVLGLFSRLLKDDVHDAKDGAGTVPAQPALQELLVMAQPGQEAEAGTEGLRGRERRSRRTDISCWNAACCCVSQHGLRMLVIFMVAAMWPTFFHITAVWLPVFEETLVAPQIPHAHVFSTFMILISVLLFPPLGMLADRVGSTRFMSVGCGLGVLLAAPALAIIEANAGSVGAAVLGQGLLIAVLCCFGPALPMWFCEASPSEARYTVVAMGYGLATALLGGFAPLCATLAYHLAGSAVWAGIFFSCVALMAGCGLVVDQATRTAACGQPAERAGTWGGCWYVCAGLVVLFAMVLMVRLGQGI